MDKKHRVKALMRQLNEILAAWDPIGVDHPRSETEYVSYAQRVLGALERGAGKAEIAHLLSNILEEEMALAADDEDVAPIAAALVDSYLRTK